MKNLYFCWENNSQQIKQGGFMKKLLSIVFFLFAISLFGQNYTLFNSSSKKLFTNDSVSSMTYSISFNTSELNGTDSVYFNFYKLNYDLYFVSDSCDFWGSLECIKQNAPSWIGKKVVYNNASTYSFYNLAGDTLQFEFSTNMNDTLLFYSDTLQKFMFIYDKTDTLNVLNVTDSARFYKIIHTDLNGNMINSALNQHEIIISKTFGLTQFFVIDSFPQILQPLLLIGNVSPNVGFYELTNEMLYDYQPGDIIQYKDFSQQSGGPPWVNYIKYRKYTILSRILTTDSLQYVAAFEYFDKDSAVLHSDIVNLNYYRHEVLAEIPFELFDGNTNQLKKTDYCGLNLWTYYTNSNYGLTFCAIDTCWGSFDTHGPPPHISTQYVAGLGIYSYSNSLFSPPPDGYNRGSRIVYFKKNGVICGDEAFTGIRENYVDKKVLIYPNPATNTITIDCHQSSIMEILNVQGQKLLQQQIQQGKTDIDISNLAQGVYFVRIIDGEKADVTIFIKE